MTCFQVFYGVIVEKNIWEFPTKLKMFLSDSFFVIVLEASNFSKGSTSVIFPDILAFAARFLKCVWPFWDIMH